MTPDATTARVSVRIREVPAAAGLRWIRLGWRAFARQPAGFLGMFALFLLLGFLWSLPLGVVLVPLGNALGLGTAPAEFLSFLPMPLLTLGFMAATEAVTNDLRIRPAMMFEALRGPRARPRSLLAVGVGYVVLAALAWFVGDSLDHGEAAAWLAQPIAQPAQAGDAAAIKPLSDSAQLALLLKAAIVALGSVPLWHAPALVAWARQGAAKAMFASVLGLWRSRGALALHLLGWLAIVLVFSMACGVLMAVLQGSILVIAIMFVGGWVMTAWFYATLWFGFQDTFDIVDLGPDAPRRALQR
ncbi:MAG: BPSS1780 family membrane protein [Burkholderiaceae bacterium]